MAPEPARGWMGHHLATIEMGQKVGGCCAPFRWGSWVPIKHNVAWAEAYLPTKWHLDPSNRLATIHQSHGQDRTNSGPIAYGKPFYKWSLKSG